MRVYSCLILLFITLRVVSQPRILQHVIIKSTLSGGSPGKAFNTRSENTDYYKNGKIRKESHSGSRGSTIIMDRVTGTSVLICELNGQLTVFEPDSAEAAGSRNKHQSGGPVVKTAYEPLNDSKFIAGYHCKHLLKKTYLTNNTVDSSYLWYTTEIELAPIYNYMAMDSAYHGERGLIMEQEFTVNKQIRPYRNVYTVTEVDTSSDIPDDKFVVPANLPKAPISKLKTRKTFPY
jgi:hypothetical protein